MSNSIKDIQEEIISEFSFMDDWMDKYNYIIDAGKQLSELSDKAKTEENRVHGCQSKVWLVSDLKDGVIEYKADSDALITKGLISLLVRVFSGQKPDDIFNADLYFIDRVGMREHLSPNRSNGLSAMIKKMKMFALAYQTQKQS